MANIYVRSTDGSDADNGTTWALAKATIAGALAIAASADTIWVSHVHSESTASAINVNIVTANTEIFRCRVAVAKTSYAVYIDPFITVT